jgi:hypothetical protein
MLAVSQRFLDALVESHRVTVAATIIPPGGSPAPAAAQVISGSLRMDRDARIRRQASVTVGFELEPNLDYIRTLPFGGYVELGRGILYADGAEETPTLATLRVDNVSWSQSQGQATLELSDRMAQVQDSSFPTPWTPNGLHPSDAIVDTVQELFGSSIVYHVSTTPATEPTLVDATYDQDRAQAISDLASSVGAAAWFDAAGDFVLAPLPPDPATVTPVWEFEVGEDGTLEEVQENLDRSAVRNGVAVRGQADASSPPIYSLAVDDDSSSPTYWGGPFGKVALIVSLTSVQSQAQADATAASLLNLRLGLARTVTLRGVPMPALEPDDVVLACYPDGREEPLRVNAVQLSLEPGSSMDVTVTGHYRPDMLDRRRARPPAIRLYAGDAAWRELAGATVVSS